MNLDIFNPRRPNIGICQSKYYYGMASVPTLGLELDTSLLIEAQVTNVARLAVTSLAGQAIGPLLFPLELDNGDPYRGHFHA